MIAAESNLDISRAFEIWDDINNSTYHFFAVGVPKVIYWFIQPRFPVEIILIANIPSHYY